MNTVYAAPLLWVPAASISIIFQSQTANGIKKIMPEYNMALLMEMYCNKLFNYQAIVRFHIKGMASDYFRQIGMHIDHIRTRIIGSGFFTYGRSQFRIVPDKHKGCKCQKYPGYYDMQVKGSFFAHL